MDYGCLISKPLDKAENILQNEGVKYLIVNVGTYKLSNPDTYAVVKVKYNGGGLILYVCGFICNAGQN